MFDNKYPYTDYHELNLDWFMGEFKKLVAEWEETKGEWNTLHDYVQNYFENLNVQTEIDNKINAMIADGTFADIVSPFVAAALPAVVAGQLPDVVAAQISSVVATQISAVVADQLPAVAAAVAAAEVEDWLTAHINPDTGYVIDDTLTVSQAAADANTAGILIGNERISFTVGKYITTNGTTYDLSDIHSNASWSYATANCQEGDKFVVTGHGGSTQRLWTFGDANGNIITAANASAIGDKLTITAPPEAVILIVNVSTSYDYYLYKYDFLRNMGESLKKDIIERNYQVFTANLRATRSRQYTGFTLSAGVYDLHVDNVTSDDTDSNTCLIQFLNGADSIRSYQCARGNNIDDVITLNSSCDSIYIFASNTSGHSTGDTVLFTNLSLRKRISDTTLSVSGGYADSKTVGDNISRIDTVMSNMKLGLKVAVFGDSIMGNDGEIVSYLNQYPDFENVYNCAFGGTCVSNRADTSSDYYYFDGVNLFTAITTGTYTDQDAHISSLSSASQAHWATIKSLDFNDIDLIILAYGTNDYWQGKTIAQITGAYNDIFEMLRTNYPTTRILVLSPIWRLVSYNSSTQTYTDSDTATRGSAGVTLRQIADGIINNCKAQRINVYDTYSNMELALETVPTFFDEVSPDDGIEVPPNSGHYYSGVHLNINGNRMYSQIIHGVINSIF